MSGVSRHSTERQSVCRPFDRQWPSPITTYSIAHHAILSLPLSICLIVLLGFVFSLRLNNSSVHPLRSHTAVLLPIISNESLQSSFYPYSVGTDLSNISSDPLVIGNNHSSSIVLFIFLQTKVLCVFLLCYIGRQATVAQQTNTTIDEIVA